MARRIVRREFLGAAAAGAFGAACAFGRSPAYAGLPIVSPGCRRTKVRVARLYLGVPGAHWPTPKMDLAEERRRYDAEFAKRAKDFADVEFAVDELLTNAEGVKKIADRLKDVDGILAIHLSMGIMGTLREILAAGKPTVLYAAPYSGHEWASFGSLRRDPIAAKLECLLTSDPEGLAVAIRPFRAIHHLREAKILNVTAHEMPADYLKAVREKFGTEIVRVPRERALAAYESVPVPDAEVEAKRWIDGAEKVVEPDRDEIVRSARLALAFEKLLADEDATVITVDCYGSMYRQLPAFPCIGFTRLNDMGLGGICESDLRSAMTHIVFQGLAGRPGFVSDPTVDESKKSIILAHCLGSRKMDGPQGEAAPYKLRSIMERQEGAVAQVRMRVGQKVTQALLTGTDLMVYFTGTVVEAPDHERGCRTKISVRVDGDIEFLWQNWSHGLHRQTCYGDIVADLRRFARFMDIRLVDEAAPKTA
ncbi:MAG: hypothetical protein ACUVYA_13225 [Planctomycetota bacterium]